MGQHLQQPITALCSNQGVCHVSCIATNGLNWLLFLPRATRLLLMLEKPLKINGTCLNADWNCVIVNEFSRSQFDLQRHWSMAAVNGCQMEMLQFPSVLFAPCTRLVLCPGRALFKLTTCVPSSSRVRPSRCCLFLKPGAQAAHRVTAVDLTARSPGPPVTPALCIGCQINEVFAFLWQSGAFSEGQRGWLRWG